MFLSLESALEDFEGFFDEWVVEELRHGIFRRRLLHGLDWLWSLRRGIRLRCCRLEGLVKFQHDLCRLAQILKQSGFDVLDAFFHEHRAARLAQDCGKTNGHPPILDAVENTFAKPAKTDDRVL